MFALLQESWNLVEKAYFFSDHLPRIDLCEFCLAHMLLSCSCGLASTWSFSGCSPRVGPPNNEVRFSGAGTPGPHVPPPQTACSALSTFRTFFLSLCLLGRHVREQLLLGDQELDVPFFFSWVQILL